MLSNDAAYSESKDLAKRTASDRVLRDKAFNIANNPRYNGYERGLASMVYKFFDKKSQKGGDVHRSPSIGFDESDDEVIETPLQAISCLYKKNPPTPLGRNKEQVSETSRANSKAKASKTSRAKKVNELSEVGESEESPLRELLGKNYESYMAKRKKRASKKNEQLADELHKPIIRKFEKRKVHNAHMDEIWAADLADMQLLSKKNKRIRYLLCVVDLFSR